MNGRNRRLITAIDKIMSDVEKGARGQVPDTQRVILKEFIRGNGILFEDQVAEQLGIEPASVRKKLSAMRKEGKFSNLRLERRVVYCLRFNNER